MPVYKFGHAKLTDKYYSSELIHVKVLPNQENSIKAGPKFYDKFRSNITAFLTRKKGQKFAEMRREC